MRSGHPLSAFQALPPVKQMERIEAEFARLRKIDALAMNAQGEFATASADVNKPRNRYTDVLANERTIFPASKKPYINANIVSRSIFNVPHDFVASQAPPADFIGEFWTAIVESKTTLVIMLTQLVERYVPKADQYWPDAVGSSQTFGDHKVTLVSEDPDPAAKDTVRRVLRVEPAGVEVTLLQYVGWPDMGVPTETAGALSLLDAIDHAPTDSPVFVHCSAGIGRTGTLISAYIVRCLARRNELADDSIPRIVGSLKQCRTGMVQRKEQLGFVYLCACADA